MPPPASEEALAAELLERLERAEGFRHAALSVLGILLDRLDLRRAALLVRTHGEVRGAAWELAPDEVEELAEVARDAGSALHAAFSADRPSTLAPSRSRLPSSIPFRLAVPLADDADGTALLLLEGPEADEESERAASIARRCSGLLIRIAATEALQDRCLRLTRTRDLSRHMMDGLPDPVLLVDSEGRVVMSNARAETLFFPTGDDSGGRSRAVQFNAFQLDVLLTEMNLEAPGHRELTLADPRDGSDLRVEVLAGRVPGPEGDGPHVAVVLHDITDLKQAAAQLEEENRRARFHEHKAVRESKRLGAILENVAQPVLVTDRESDIVLMNREAERLFGRPDDGGVERGQATRTNVTKMTSFVNDLLLHGEHQRKSRLDLVDPDDDGELPMEAVSTKIVDDRREASVVVSVLRDLRPLLEKARMAGELRELNQRLEHRVREATRELEERNRLLNWQSQELEKASRLKSEFLASMSHELRTPINAMLGYTSLMRDRIYGPLSDEQERALEKVNSASEHLLDLINDILDLSKIEAGKMPVEVEEVRMEEIAEELRETVQPLFRDDGVELRVELEDGLPVLEVDPTKVRQILLNLVENALRFTDEGWVAVRASSDEGGERIRLEVEDTGEGIEEENLEAIFDDFRQLDSGESGRKGGVGLGLSISRKLTSLMGGTIEVRSERGRGTRFVIDLPAKLEPGDVEEQVQRVLMDMADDGDHPPESSDDLSVSPRDRA